MFKILILIFVFLNFSLQAEENLLTLKQQVDRLQREVNDLSKLVFQNSIHENFNNAENDSSDLNNITAFDIRIYDIENDIKNIYSNYEDISFQMEELRNLINEISIKIDTEIINRNEVKSNEIVNSEEIQDPETKNSLGTLKINSEDLSGNTEGIEKKISNNEVNNTNANKELTIEEEYQLAFDLLRSQKFDQAKIALNEFIVKHENKELSGSAHYWLGEIHLLQKDYREAALIFAEGYQKYQSSVKAPDTLYKLAIVLTKIDKNLEACSTFKKLQQEYNNHKFIDKTIIKIKELECD